MTRMLPLLALLAACGEKKTPTETPQESTAASTEEYGAYGDVLTSVTEAIDPAADPCNDFYQYACGGWLEEMELPEDRARFSRSFTTILEDNEAFVRGMLEEAAAEPGDDPNLQLVGSYYASCMDTEAIEAKGAEPLAPALEMIDGVSTVEDAWVVSAKLQFWGVETFITGFSESDFKDPNQVLLWILQNGLGLPDREYYFPEDDKGKELLTEYEAHVGRSLALSGMDEESAAAAAASIVAFETALAENHWEPKMLRSPENTYNPADRAAVKEAMPGMPVDAYFEALGIPELDTFNLMTPDPLAATSKVVAETEVDTLKHYLRFHLVSGMSMKLSEDFRDEKFSFYGQKLNGTPAQPPRWRTCVNTTGDALGEVIGRAYVTSKFSGDSKDKALEMIQRIEQAFEAGVDDLEWMDDDTRMAARDKAGAITNKIGFPDQWRDYSSVELSADDYAGNHIAATTFEVNRVLDKAGKERDPAEWYMPPQTVNAYYNPTMNEIVFPAGIMQPPFFSAEFPAAMNYGAMGMVMGHEITHGFDDEGRKFDKTGRFSEWWAPEVAERFEARAQCVDDQYSGYEELPGQFVDGKLTLGENIADAGGIKLAYRAYKAWEAEHGEEDVGDAYTADQLFFLAHAQGWCQVATEELRQRYLTTDPHSPARWRVVGPLQNFPEFAESFECEAGDAMVAEQVCEVW